jgi:dihydrofolate synthase/folylpolyglutamate synthase
MSSIFLEFLSALSNPEKTRNFNQFTHYTLDNLSKTFAKLELDRTGPLGPESLELEARIWSILEPKLSVLHPRRKGNLNRARIAPQTHRPLRISVVGTNGKGSFAHYLSQIFQSRLEVPIGLYTSPHFISPLERIQVNDEDSSSLILDAIFSSLNSDWIDILKEHTFFEVMTIFCILYFRLFRLPIEIYEAGLGGRLDATKLCKAEVVVLTSIGFDHTEILGNTKTKILSEKLGILTNTTKRFFSMHLDSQELENLILEKTKPLGVKVAFFPQQEQKPSYLETYFSYAKFCIEEMESGLDRNFVSSALGNEVSSMEKLSATETQRSPDIFLPIRSIREAFPKFSDISPPQGRMERISGEPNLYYDTAHNPDAVDHIFREISLLYPNTEWNWVLASLPDKDLIGMLRVGKKYRFIKSVFVCDFAPFAIREPLESEEGIEFIRIKDASELEEILKQKLGSTGINWIALGSFRLYPILRLATNPQSKNNPEKI